MNNNKIILNKNNSSKNIIQFKKATNNLRNKFKGFWRVQSLNILNHNLNKKFNIKEMLFKTKIEKITKFNDFLKVKSLSPPKKIFKNKSTNIINNVNNYYSNVENNFFITKIEENKNFNKNNIRILKTIFKNFPNEPFLYNEINFFSLKTYYKNVKPRTFKEVLNDCKKFNEYESQKKINNIDIYKKNSRNILNLPVLNKKDFSTNIDLNNNNSNSSNNNNNNFSANNNTLLNGKFKNSFFSNNKIKNKKTKNLIRNVKIKAIENYNNKIQDSKKYNLNFYKSLNSSSSLNKISTKYYTNNNIF